MKKNRSLIRFMTILAALLAAFFFYLVHLRIDYAKIKSLSAYEDAAQALLNNLGEIQELDKQGHANKYKYGQPPFFVLSTGRYYFEHTVMKSIPDDMSAVLALWQKDFVTGEFHAISMTSDSIIAFRIYLLENPIFAVEHFLVHDEKGNAEELQNSFCTRVRRINEKWLYYSVGTNSFLM